MKKKRTYRTEHVEQVRVIELLPALAAGCIVALDVAKAKFVVALATLSGEVVKLFRFEHPTESRIFLSLVDALRGHVEPGKLRAAMEPTGTYGDAIRHQLGAMGVPVCMVSPKKTHDSREVFDGVPSMHDPKSAVLIAKLCSMDLSSQWLPRSDALTRVRALVDQRHHACEQRERCFGRLEGLLSRHWPEFFQWMDLRLQRTAPRLLMTFPGPARVHAEPERVAALLRASSCGRLSKQAIDGVLEGAAATLGVPMLEEQSSFLMSLAEQVDAATDAIEKLDHELAAVGKHDEVFVRLAAWMGPYTAAVIVTKCDLRRYTSARQLEKACGLNLREKSSGEDKGRLSITKRGPSLVRKVLFMFALRMIYRSHVVRAWYMRRRGYTEQVKQRAVVAVMRKLVRAILPVASGAPFDEGKLFDLRRLDLEATPPSPKQVTFESRTVRRSIARGNKRGGASAAAAST